MPNNVSVDLGGGRITWIPKVKFDAEKKVADIKVEVSVIEEEVKKDKPKM